MTVLEKEITDKNVELARNHEMLKGLSEIEQKLVPKNPEALAAMFKESAVPVDQLYLSSPDEEFSLRVRRIETEDGAVYSAALKDRGEIIDGALKRMEVSTEISAQTYEHYKAMELPNAPKLRAEPLPGVTVDFYEKGPAPVVIEIEHEDAEVRDYLKKVMEEMTGVELEDRSDDIFLTTESIAHASRGFERAKKPESLDTFVDRVFAEMVAHYVSGKNQVVVTLKGMSGSGKSTAARLLQERFIEAYGEQMKPAILSTDDYHYGKEHLENEHGAPYVTWDKGRTYNTPALARDLQLLAQGVAVQKRHFSFETQEPVMDNEFIEPTAFVIVEGLHAGSSDLHNARDVHFDLPTPPATCVGRDVRRIAVEGRANEAFPDPQSRFRYQMEVALPAYFEQEQPRRQSFSASVRPMASRAFMLAELRK